jgi:hypothetical protein
LARKQIPVKDKKESNSIRAVSIHPETFNVLVVPVWMLVGALNSNLDLHRCKILNISGLSSSQLDR